MEKKSDCLEKVSSLVNRAKRAGADDADAIYVEGTSLSLACRKGKKEIVQP